MTYVRTHLAPDVACKGTTVTFKYENPEPGDNVSAAGSDGSYTFTEDTFKIVSGVKVPDCNTYAKFYSTNNKQKYGVTEYKTADGKTYSSIVSLNFHLATPGSTSSEETFPLPWESQYVPLPTVAPVASPTPVAPPVTPIPSPNTQVSYQAPEMVYPKDGQVLDLEGAYMFKVKPVSSASGYLFGLFQDQVMVYENYRDHRILSSNGEFAVWESNPYHNKFHKGELKVMVRTLINGQWSDAREITVQLRPRNANAPAAGSNTPDKPNVTVTGPFTSSWPKPILRKTGNVQVVTDSSAGAALQKKIEELENKLQQSQQRQSTLESRLNKLIDLLKSILPFFKG